MARSFDGTTSASKLSAAVDQGNQGITLVAWCRPASAVGANVVVVENVGTTHYFALQTTAAGNFFATASDGTNFPNATSGAFTLNAWNHCAATLSGGLTIITAYTNGVATSAAATLTATTDKNVVSLGSDNGTPQFSGEIFDVGIWKCALTGPEIAALANGTARPLQIRPEHLVAYWVLDEGSGSAVSVSKVKGFVQIPTSTTVTGRFPPKVARSPTIFPPLSMPMILGLVPSGVSTDVYAWTLESDASWPFL